MAIYISTILKLFVNVVACMHSSAIDCQERVEPPTAISAPTRSLGSIAPIFVKNADSYARFLCINFKNKDDGMRSYVGAEKITASWFNITSIIFFLSSALSREHPVYFPMDIPIVQDVHPLQSIML